MILLIHKFLSLAHCIAIHPVFFTSYRLKWLITACCTILILNCMYWYSCRGVSKYILLISMVINFASGVLMTQLRTIFAASRSAVSVLTSPWNFNWSTPMIILFLWHPLYWDYNWQLLLYRWLFYSSGLDLFLSKTICVFPLFVVYCFFNSLEWII